MIQARLLTPRLQLPGVPFMTAAAIGPISGYPVSIMPSLLRSADVKPRRIVDSPGNDHPEPGRA